MRPLGGRRRPIDELLHFTGRNLALPSDIQRDDRPCGLSSVTPWRGGRCGTARFHLRARCHREDRRADASCMKASGTNRRATRRSRRRWRRRSAYLRASVTARTRPGRCRAAAARSSVPHAGPARAAELRQPRTHSSRSTSHFSNPRSSARGCRIGAAMHADLLAVVDHRHAGIGDANASA